YPPLRVFRRRRRALAAPRQPLAQARPVAPPCPKGRGTRLSLSPSPSPLLLLLLVALRKAAARPLRPRRGTRLARPD
ncbi:MAG: hypothetical protein OXR73_37805, partial [Myxococcales bacterium]|nr:hypothetical protein [Myxococcales bacterium]